MVQNKQAQSTLSRDSILESIRQKKPDVTPLPPVGDLDDTPKNLTEQFLRRLEAAGGVGHLLDGELDLVSCVSTLFPVSEQVYSNIPALESLKPFTKPVNEPQDYDSLDVAVLQAEFGVGENGAVWITDQAVDHRSVLFLPQHLVLVIPENSIVPNMFHAYQLISSSRPRFGCFISGPSKTADIEQTLVLGAHGARSLHVILI